MIRLPLIDDKGNVIKSPSDWREITLSKWIEFSEMLVQLAKGSNLLEEGKDFSDMTIHDLIASYPSYVIKVVSFWSGLTESEINQLEYTDIVSCFTMINEVLQQPKQELDWGGFKFRGKYYMKPKTVKDINGNDILAKDTSFINMVEYLQLSLQGQKVAENVFTEMPKQIATLFRLSDEQYNEDVASIRAEIFKDLPMDIVWQVAFFLQSLKSSYEILILQSLTENLQEMKAEITGDTTTLSIQPLTVISRIWRRLRKRIFTK